MSDEEIDQLLEKELGEWMKKYSKIENLTTDIADQASLSFEETIEKVKSKAWKKKVSTIDVLMDPRSKAGRVKIDMETTKMQNFALLARTDPDNKQHMINYLKCLRKRTEYYNLEVEKQLNNDISKQDMNNYVCLRKFYKTTGEIMTVDGQLKLTSAPLTTEEEKERLEANNKTYYDENYQDDIDRYKKIFAERKFNFDFLDEAEMTRIIKRTKRLTNFSIYKPVPCVNRYYY